MIEVTQEAAQALRRSLDLIGADPDSAGIRLASAKGLGGGLDVQISFADRPAPGETSLQIEGLNFFVEPAVLNLYPTAVIALEPQHETVVFREAAG